MQWLGSQRVRHDLVTQQQQKPWVVLFCRFKLFPSPLIRVPIHLAILFLEQRG